MDLFCGDRMKCPACWNGICPHRPRVWLSSARSSIVRPPVQFSPHGARFSSVQLRPPTIVRLSIRISSMTQSTTQSMTHRQIQNVARALHGAHEDCGRATEKHTALSSQRAGLRGLDRWWSSKASRLGKIHFLVEKQWCKREDKKKPSKHKKECSL